MVERKRHFAKAITYRVFGSAATGVIALVLSKQYEVALGVALADSVVKVVLYYAHERVWYHIPWGVHPGKPHANPQKPVHTVVPGDVPLDEAESGSTRRALGALRPSSRRGIAAVGGPARGD